ncbi:helix-turn-helix transcriptional regulator [Thermodesulfobacteriota bacterium]
MGRDKSQLLRLLFIDRKIRDGMASGVLANCSSMAGEYEVSAKSILRDIDYLRHQRDAPIAYDSSRRGYYYSEEQYQLPAIDLNESDLFAICIAEQALTQHENSPVYQRLKGVFDKIEASLPSSVTVQPDWLAKSLSVVPEHQTRIDGAVWATVTEGLRKHLALSILHERPGAVEPTVRCFDPYHIVRWQGEWYLVGHCHLRAALRTFAVSRIRSATLLTDSFVVPDDFDPDSYRAGRFGIFGPGGDHRVRIAFNRDCAPYLLERQWHPEQEIIKQADGGVEITFPAANLHTVRQWVLSWGGGARVLAPDLLAMAVKAELEKALAGYGELQLPRSTARNTD